MGKRLVGLVVVAVAIGVGGGTAAADDPPGGGIATTPVPNNIVIGPVPTPGYGGPAQCFSSVRGTLCISIPWSVGCDSGQYSVIEQPADPQFVTRLVRGHKMRWTVDVGTGDGSCRPIGALMRRIEGVDSGFQPVKAQVAQAAQGVEYRFDLRPLRDTSYYVAVDGVRVTPFMLVQPFKPDWP